MIYLKSPLKNLLMPFAAAFALLLLFEPAWPQDKNAQLAQVSAGHFMISPIPGGMQGRISLDLRNIDVVDALKFFSLKTGINIISTKSVAGRVNLIVENAPIQDVFDVMLRSNSLAYDKQGEIYNVMTQDEYKALYGKNFADTRQVKVLHLQYAIPEHIFSLLDMIKSDIGRVLVDTESGSILIMDSPEKIAVIEKVLVGFEQKNVVKVFSLNYARAKDVEEALKTQLDTKKAGMVKADERSNQVLVQTLPERMNQIEKIIKDLDTKTKEIIIDCRIIKVKLSDEKNTGVRWEGIFDLARKFGMAYLGSVPFSSVSAATDPWRSRQQVLKDVGYAGSYPFTGTSSQFAAGKQSIGTEEMHVGIVGKQDFDVVINYIQTLGEARIISNPKLAVVNNQEAKIHVGRKEAYVTTTTTSGQATSTISEQVTFVDVGVLLSVVPNINNEGFVTLKVKSEISEVIDVLITPTKNQIPILDTSLAETTVMVKEGSTIIIGGLRKEENAKDTSRTPFFASIPVLGKLFSQSKRSKDVTELMIILTPRLISGEILVTNASGKGLAEEQIKSTKGYSDSEAKGVKGSETPLPSEVFVPMDKKGLILKGTKHK